MQYSISDKDSAEVARLQRVLSPIHSLDLLDVLKSQNVQTTKLADLKVEELKKLDIPSLRAEKFMSDISPISGKTQNKNHGKKI